MSGRWLNLFLRFSSYIFALKQKIVDSKSWTRSLPYVILLFVLELLFLIFSFPLYLLVSPKSLQEQGLIFPTKAKEPAHFHVYVVRRRISLITIFGTGGIFLLKFVFIGLISASLLGAQSLLAATQDWIFNTSGEYTYNAAKIAVTGGAAQLVDQGGGGSCGGTATACTTFSSSPTCTTQAGCSWGGGASGATTNSGFNTSSTGWTGADWLQPTQTTASETYRSNGGNPGGYVEVGLLTTKKNKTIAGLWRQSFTTTVSNPTTATLNLDWKSQTYTAPSAPTTYQLYAFIDTASGNPTLGQQVWASGEITSTTGWANVSNINIASKIPTAGTYYLKIVAYVTTPNTDNSFNFISNFDNVIVNWSTASTCSGTATACTTYSSSSNCGTQAGCAWAPVAVYPTDSPAITPTTSLAPVGVTSWNSFAETATKNGGSINYQLSGDDGANWKYWNGSTWVAASTSANSNAATVVNSNINAFSIAGSKITWKAFLVSTGSQQVVLDNVAVGYTQNAIPVVQTVTATQNTSTGFVNVNYNLKDDNNDPNHLVNYEYSLTGAFAGEEVAMTPVVSDPAHSGISGLTTSASGVAHTFVWDARTDLGAEFNNAVYVRIRAHDGIANSNFGSSAAFSVDYVVPSTANVTVAPVSSSQNFQINYNLTDNTATNITVELQISSDNGSTWTVPATSVTGDVGSTVTSGNGKSIIWQAGTDFANQENSTMLVRIRAMDKYQNQGDYVDSSSFVIDNYAPRIATPADLLAQPTAGATTVLVGGSFTEANPNTNNFFVKVNSGSYGSAQAGDTDTASPSNKSVTVPSALKGNDYIAAVKIEHTDDFSQMTANENTSPTAAYRFVKPYTPPAPTISNPGATALSVTINKYADEASGLEYAIFENSQSLYVQSDGSLGSSAYWQPTGTVSVTGLSQPISQYSFKVKSRNTSDTSYAATSESEFSSSASSDYQSQQITINSVAQTTDGTKYVTVHYQGIDSQSASNDLVKYEYSLNGTDWQTMTEKSGVGSNGVTGLSFTNSGTSLLFAWDVGTDLPSTENSAVYVRLESNNAITNSNIAVSSAFVVNTAAPVVSNINVSQTASTDNVIITYDLAEAAGTGINIALAISDDSGATYTVPVSDLTGDVGSTVTAGVDRTITWDAGAHFSDQEKTTTRIKITATDSFQNEAAPVESSDFALDTKAPAVTNVSASQLSGSALVAVTYTLADQNSSNVEFEVSSNSGVSWSVAHATYTGDMGADQTAGAKTFNWNAVVDYPEQEKATMQIRVRALDSFGHQGTYAPSADFSVNTKVLSISDITVVQTTGTQNVSVHYDLNKAATITLEISSDGGVNWTVPTTTATGQVGPGITAGNNKAVTWNPAIDFSNEEKTTMRVRLSGVDSLGITSPYYESSDFTVDTAAPLGLLDLNKFASTADSVTMNWSSGVADAHFKRYELWHGTNQSDVINRTGTASKWSVTQDSSLDSATAISTVITGVNLTSNYFVKIWALDDYGNEVTIPDLNVYSAPVTYSLEIQAPTGNGSTAPVTGSQSYAQGENAEITATAEIGWSFDHWILDSAPGGSTNPLTIAMDGNHAIKAIFTENPIITYGLTIQAPTGTGFTNPDTGSHEYNAGENAEITATAGSGWIFDHWTLDSADGGSNNPLTITMNASHTLKAVFTEVIVPPTVYHLTVQSSTGSGSVDPDVGSHNYNEGSSAIITATPADHGLFDHWTVDGSSAGSTNPLTVEMNANHSVKATFVAAPPPTYSLDIQAPTGSGSTDPVAGSHSYTENDNAQIAALAEAGWQFDHWIINEASGGTANPLTLTMTANTTLKAVFTEIIVPPITFDLTIQDTTGSGLTNPGTGAHSYVEGTDAQVAATASDGWTFDHWILDGGNGGSSNPLTVTMNATHTLKAVFTEIVVPPTIFSLTVQAPTGSGSTDPATGSHDYVQATTAEILATAGEGWAFDHWILDGSGGGSTNPLSITMNADHTVKAVFLVVPPTVYSLTIQAPTGSGSTDPGTGSHDYNEGDNAQITAIAAGGWEFDHWVLDGSASGSANHLTIVMDTNHSLQAVFTETVVPPIVFALTIQAPTGSGTTNPDTGSQNYNKGDNASITATAADGWTFDHWTLDGGAGGSINPLIIAMNASHTLKAVFTEIVIPPAVFSLDIQDPTGSGLTNPGTGSHAYDEGTSPQITALASTDWNFDHWILDDVDGGTSNPLSVVMNANHTLKAIFTEVVTARRTTGTPADTTPPAKPIVTPLQTPTNTTSIEISGLAEAGAHLQLFDNGTLIASFDNVVASNGQFSQTFNFTEGSHSLTIKAIDAANNVSDPSDAVALDIITHTQEALIILSPQNNDQLTDPTPTIYGVSSAFAQIVLVLDGRTTFNVSANKDGGWSFKLPTDSALDDGNHRFSVTATDRAGNKSSAVELVITKVAPTIPPPEIVITPTTTLPGTTTSVSPVSPVTLVIPVSPATGRTPVVPPPAELVRNNVTALELAGIPVPEVNSVNAVVSPGAGTTATADLFTFTGKALPNQDVLVYIHSDQALIYRTKADAKGLWAMTHSQGDVELTPGQHTVYAVAIDPAAKVKSKPSPIAVFTVEKSLWVTLFNLLNLQTTIATLIIILLALVWLYRLKKKGAAV